MVTSAEFPSASGLGKCIGCPSSLRYQRPAEHLVSSSGCYCWLSMYLCATFVLRNNKASEGGVPSKSELESQLAMTLEEGTRGGADSNHIGMAVSMTQNPYRGVRRACSTKQHIGAQSFRLDGQRDRDITFALMHSQISCRML